MHYARRTSFPQIPKTISDVHSILNSTEIKTTDNEQFLLLNTDTLIYFLYYD